MMSMRTSATVAPVTAVLCLAAVLLGPAFGESLGREAAVERVSSDQAAAAALRQNAELQAAFDELGIATADLEQAGLYSNPSLSALWRVPRAGGVPNWELKLTTNLADLWLVPARRSLERARRDEVTFRIASEVLNTTANARLAHMDCLIQQALLADGERVLAAVEKWRDEVRDRFDYGYSSELDISMADAEVSEGRVAVEQARAALNVARARLARLLGLPAGVRAEAVGELPQAPATLPNLEALTARAVERRPDLIAARLGLSGAERALALERRRVWSYVALGPAYSHEPDGTDLWGALFEVQVPLADDGSARRARALSERDRALHRAQALEARVREQVTVAWEGLALALQREATLRSELLPARERAVAHAERYWQQMQLNSLYLLEARRLLAQARERHTRAQGEIERARIELEFATGEAPRTDGVPGPAVVRAGDISPGGHAH